MRFRSHKAVLVADIEKSCLQVDLQERDRDVTRFLWLKDITKPVAVLRFIRMPFGVISSQVILAATDTCCSPPYGERDSCFKEN